MNLTALPMPLTMYWMGYGGSLGSDVNGMGLGIGGRFTRFGFALQELLGVLGDVMCIFG